MSLERVTVEWLDSQTIDHGGWTSLADIKDAMDEAGMTYTSTGYVVAETDVALAIALSLNSQRTDGQGVLVIPKGAIQEIRREAA